jgi:hypothetical protein
MPNAEVRERRQRTLLPSVVSGVLLLVAVFGLWGGPARRCGGTVA